MTNSTNQNLLITLINQSNAVVFLIILFTGYKYCVMFSQWTGQHGGMVTCCQFSLDGQLLVSGSDLDNTVKVWDVHTGELIQEIKDLHTSTITSCQFNPAGDKLVTTSMDKTTRFYDLKSQCNTLKLGWVIHCFCRLDFSQCDFERAMVPLWH